MTKTMKIEGLTPLQHAREWQKLADDEERRDKKARKRGDVFGYGMPAYIETLKRCAAAYRLQHRTGKLYCSYHMVPLGECPEMKP